MTDRQDFSFVPTETLIDELKRRTDALVLSFEERSERGVFICTYHGNSATCLGLAEMLRDYLIRLARKNETGEDVLP